MNNVYFDSKKNTIGDEKESSFVFITKPNGKFVFSEVCDGEETDAAVNIIVDSFTVRVIAVADLPDGR